MGKAPPKFDISIAGDEQEQSRIQLEKNLLHTDLSLHLSSTHDDFSVENPRHHSSVSAPFSAFNSIDPSRDALDMDEGISQLHAWSYRTGEDDEGVRPFVGGETLSTAAHHASALTLSAGLAGRGERRDVSLSGAEYDPDRPLQDLIAGMGSQFSLLGADQAPSRHASNTMPIDSRIVDSTTEFNRVLSTQQARAAVRHVRSPRSEQSTSSSSSELDTPDPTLKPKLSDALSHLMLSPKRPRSPALRPRSASHTYAPAQRPIPSSSRFESQQPPQPHHLNARSSSFRTVQPDVGEGEPTPRPRKIKPHMQPDNALRPPTPSTANSHFTRLARGLAREIEVEQSRWHAPVEIEGLSHVGPKESGPTLRTKAMPPNAFVGSSNAKQRLVQLPDVTGLTVAVESPAKGQSHQSYGNIGKESEDPNGHARLQQAMNLLQKKIAHLDTENHTSRKRMKELEHELDVCRQDVERQRTFIAQREDLLVRQQRMEAADSRMKGKARAIDDARVEQKRYKQSVEEKKALESLIATLRSHMARLTSELATHKALLDELRTLREADKSTLRQKVREVDLLRREVEKIAGEVEVLRGVVEDGLRERRERSLSNSHDGPQDHGPDASQEGNIDNSELGEGQDEDGDGSPNVQQDADDYEIQDVQPALARRALLERTIRTDHATFGSTPMTGNVGRTRRYVDHDEVERISVELEERRSERSRSSSRLGSSLSSNGSHRAPSVASSIGSARSSRIVESPVERAATPDSIHQWERVSSPPPAVQVSRPSAPTPAHAARERPPAGETPFPQIRGARLERMFFSAPEHNAKTCTVCHRRRHYGAAQRPLWYPASKGRKVTVADVGEDEGFEEGSIADGERGHGATMNLDFLDKGSGSDKLPPQTVLVRVLRELEDDFTHYKGIYTELADQYKVMDAASNVVKRNVLAQHLREVIDVLEQRGDQIASLYDLLTFEDKPVARSVVPEKDCSKHHTAPTCSERTRQAGSRKRLTFA
ncbi:hypothetical protein EDB83DRAFT_2548255 [Lactarius deliciosus]|nr:hypothetical protein EDB83DRAFT_2552398 [Lactarius deliciosus]KAH9080683.1 hypothetical protein EDB83DRAFT_2548255 [Lactarius deliciosus]